MVGKFLISVADLAIFVTNITYVTYRMKKIVQQQHNYKYLKVFANIQSPTSRFQQH